MARSERQSRALPTRSERDRCGCTSGCSRRPARCRRPGTPSARGEALAEAIAATTTRRPGRRAHGRSCSASAPPTWSSTRSATAYRCWVEDLAVNPEHRSQGVGKALLDAAKEWARERGATHLSSTAARRAPTRTASTTARTPALGPVGLAAAAIVVLVRRSAAAPRAYPRPPEPSPTDLDSSRTSNGRSDRDLPGEDRRAEGDHRDGPPVRRQARSSPSPRSTTTRTSSPSRSSSR